MNIFLIILYWYLGLGIVTTAIVIAHVVNDSNKTGKALTGEDLGGFLFCIVVWPIVVGLGIKELFNEKWIIYDPKARARKKAEKLLKEQKKKSELLEDQLDIIKEETKIASWFKR